MPPFSLQQDERENLGFCIITLDDWDQRKSPELSIHAIRAKIQSFARDLPQANLRVFQPPAIKAEKRSPARSPCRGTKSGRARH